MIPATRVPAPPLGWPLLPVPGDDGALAFPGLAESVRQNLQVILATRPGELLLHPGYGAGLIDFIGEPDTVVVRRRIHDRVTENIARWEARVTVDLVDVTEVPSRPGQLRVHVGYRLRRTGEARSFGVNLELTAS